MKKKISGREETWIYGIHAVEAALLNKNRTCYKLLLEKDNLVSGEVLKKSKGLHPKLIIEGGDPKMKERLQTLFGRDAVHQGLALQTKPLDELALEELPPHSDQSLVLILDQVTDPHNVGAILRSAAAFGAHALICPDHNSPSFHSPILAKSASGALEHVPIIKVTNLSRALDHLKKNGYWCVGLDEHGKPLNGIQLPSHIALILGAEGKGLRRLTEESCDFLVSLPTTKAFSTLNVSNAAAVALYEIRRQNPFPLLS